MADIHIRPRTPDDDERIVAMHNAVFLDQPDMTVEEWREYDIFTPPEAEREIVVAERDGRVVGDAFSSRQVHTESRDAWRVGVLVDRQCLHQGIGSGLADHVLQRVSKEAKAKLYTDIREDDPESLAFAEHRDFKPSGKADRVSRLMVASANVDGCLRAYERVTAAGISIKTMDEIGLEDKQFLHRLYRVDVESSRDMPSSNPFTDMPYDEWFKFFESRLFKPECFWVAMEGEEVAGLAVLTLRSGKAAFNNYTGVGPDYRGRGIARALKYCTVVWCRENGVEAIFTGNEMSNKPMLAINIELGYEALPAEIEYVREMGG